MIHLIVLVFLGISLGNVASDCSRQCDFPILLYQSAKCVGVYKKGSKSCATYYKCNKLLDKPENQCFIGGNYYEVDEAIPQEEVIGSCLSSCKCRDKSIVRCINEFCPRDRLVRPGCRFTYAFDECCPTGTICPTDSTDYCEVEGRKYYEGEQFMDPKSLCSRCICMKKGDNLVPSCRKIECAIFMWRNAAVQQHCAPVYPNLSTCCPIDFKCPAATDKIIQNCSADDSRVKCRYGDKLYGRGTKIESPNYNCLCTIPPFFTCIRN